MTWKRADRQTHRHTDTQTDAQVPSALKIGSPLEEKITGSGPSASESSVGTSRACAGPTLD